MRRRNILSIIVVVCFTLLTFTAGRAHSEESDISNAAVLFLLSVNSPRANGMGGCVVNLVDGQSGYYNPGATGLFHLDRIASFAAPNNTKWLPELADDMRLKTWSLSLGGSYCLISRSPDSRFNASVALSFSRMKMEYGEFQQTAEGSSEVIGTFEAYDAVKTYTVSVGVEYYVRLGLGYTVKKIESQLADVGAGSEVGIAGAEGDAHDYGVIVELPIHSFFRERTNVDQPPGHNWQFELTPSFAFVKSNTGDDLTYIDAAQSDPLPEISRSGLSIAAALTHNQKPLLSARYIRENEKLLLGEEPETRKRGFEFGLLGTVYIRFGSFDSDADPKLSTQGFGFRLRGIIDWLGLADKPRFDGGIMRYLITHIDLSYDYAKWDKNADQHPAADTKFAKLSFSF